MPDFKRPPGDGPGWFERVRESYEQTAGSAGDLLGIESLGVLPSLAAAAAALFVAALILKAVLALVRQRSRRLRSDGDAD